MATTRHPTRLREATTKANATAIDTDKYLEKDATEIRLERALFGDDAGFLDALKPHASDYSKALQKIGTEDVDIIGDENDQEDLDDVPDEDLFFLDAGTGDLPPAIIDQLEQEHKDDDVEDNRPVWYDSDDDRITVSLASNTRLRKLRDTEDDDVVNGRDYILRLRRQYERLHPTPDWVTYARKKRKLSTNADNDGSDVDSDVSIVDADDMPTSTQPLAELLRSAESLTRADTADKSSRKYRKLRPEVLDIQRTKDVASTGPSSVDTLQFHPYYPLLMTGGPSSTLSLYHVSPQPPNPNPLLTSLHIKGTPLHTASFCIPFNQQQSTTHENDQTRIFLSSRRRYFHTWSLSTGVITKVTRPLYGSQARKDQRTTEFFKTSPCGRYMGLVSSARQGGGSINIISTESMQWVCSCRIDSAGGVADFDWWRSGDGFAVVGKNGEVSEYSITSKRVICRWWDEGSVGTTVLAIGGGGGGGADNHKNQTDKGRWIALGSSSGIVNIYDRRSAEFVKILEEGDGQTSTSASVVKIKGTTTPISAAAAAATSTITTHRPKPTRVFDQLTTPTSHLTFSHDGQMLVLASRWKKNALRLVHLPSCTVYRNWPTDKTPLGRVSSVALSRDGALLAVGNESGKVRLWEIRE